MASLLFLSGLLVQTGAILTNFDSYFNQYRSKVGWDPLLYNPTYSPAWGHWTLWSERYEEWKQYRSDLEEYRNAKFTFHGGLHPIEAEDFAPYGRWTSSQVDVDLYVLPEQTIDLTITYWRPQDEGVPQGALAFYMDGRQLESSSIVLDSGTSGRHEDSVSVTAEQIATFPPRVVITSSVWSPVLVGISEDNRQLGVFIESISVQADGTEMQAGKTEPLFPRMPLTASRPWNSHAFWWFWRLDAPHLVDSWWWYVSVVGFLPGQVRTVLSVGLAIIGLIGGASLYVLVTELKRASSHGATSG